MADLMQSHGVGRTACASCSTTRASRALTSTALRDTFAVELLLKGTPIEEVAILLGHSSIRVTEKHYSPRPASNCWKATSGAPAWTIQFWTNHTIYIRPSSKRFVFNGGEGGIRTRARD